MGAKDNIMEGHSTFYVELAETAAMLHKATPRWGEQRDRLAIVAGAM